MQFQRANTTTAQKFKVIFRGETKRIPPARDYNHLYKLASDCFSEQLAAIAQSKKFKFFYLDEDNELISISSQSDFEFAMSLEMPGSLRLIVEFDQNAARQQLMDHLENTQNMSQMIRNGDLNESQIFDRQSTVISTRNSIPNPYLRQDSAFGDFDHTMPVPNTDRTPFRQPIELSQSLLPMDNKPKVESNVANMLPKLNMEEVLAGALDNQGLNNNLIQAKPAQQKISQEDQKDSDSGEDFGDMTGPMSNEKITCFKCKGTKINKRGNPCKKCSGTGEFTGIPVAIADSIKEQVSTYLESAGNFKAMIDEYLNSRRDVQNAVVHKDIICDRCEAPDIKGIRYMSTTINDYDICQKCEALNDTKGAPFLKIRNEKQAPARIVCQYNNMGQSAMGESNLNLHQFAAQQKPVAQQMQPATAPAQQMQASKEKYLARFVKDSHGDGLRVTPGQKFQVSWTFRNTGKTAWPKDTVLIHTSGDELGVGQNAGIPENITVGVEQEYTFAIEVTAPALIGRYTAFYRLSQSGQRFGQKVWADIRVVEPEPVVAVEVPRMVPQEPVLTTPKQLYLIECTKEGMNDDLKQKMITLFEFGFSDFETNRDLLNKHKGNVETVAGELSEQLLSKSYY